MHRYVRISNNLDRKLDPVDDAEAKKVIEDSISYTKISGHVGAGGFAETGGFYEGFVHFTVYRKATLSTIPYEKERDQIDEQVSRLCRSPLMRGQSRYAYYVRGIDVRTIEMNRLEQVNAILGFFSPSALTSAKIGYYRKFEKTLTFEAWSPSIDIETESCAQYIPQVPASISESSRHTSAAQMKALPHVIDLESKPLLQLVTELSENSELPPPQKISGFDDKAPQIEWTSIDAKEQKKYWVVVGSFKDRNNAQELVDAINAKDYELHASIGVQSPNGFWPVNAGNPVPFSEARVLKVRALKLEEVKQVFISEEKNAGIAKAAKAEIARINIGKPERIQNIVVRYYPKYQDEPKIRESISDLGYKVERGSPQLPGIPVNSIWYGNDVSVSDVKLVSLTLMEAGFQIRSIRRFNHPNKPNIIEIGSDMDRQNYPVWTLESLVKSSDFPSDDTIRGH